MKKNRYIDYILMEFDNNKLIYKYAIVTTDKYKLSVYILMGRERKGQEPIEQRLRAS